MAANLGTWYSTAATEQMDLDPLQDWKSTCKIQMIILIKITSHTNLCHQNPSVTLLKIQVLGKGVEGSVGGQWAGSGICLTLSVVSTLD
jgi:hypothetical protein